MVDALRRHARLHHADTDVLRHRPDHPIPRGGDPRDQRRLLRHQSPGPSPLRLVLSGIFMGLGIVAMHYTGMAAMRGHAELSYDRHSSRSPCVIAIGASTAALWLAFRTTDLWQRLVAAVVMGLAISGMHYTAMRAAIFTAHGPVHEAPGHASLDQTNLALAVAGITFVILAFALIASLSEQKRAEEALRQARADLARVNRVTTMGALTASLAHEVNQPIAAAVSQRLCLPALARRRDPESRRSARGCDEHRGRRNACGGNHHRTRLLFKKGTPQRELVDVNEVIREMIVLLRSEIDAITPSRSGRSWRRIFPTSWEIACNCSRS